MASDGSKFSTGYAVIIGTGTDIKGEINSRFDATINDAEWIAQVLKAPSLCAFPENHVKLLVGRNATRERIVAELDSLQELVESGDSNESITIVVFFSGHGLRLNRKTYLIPYGYGVGQPLDSCAIDGDVLFQKLKLVGADRILLLLNCCHSGSVVSKLGQDDENDQTKVLLGPLTEGQIKRLSKGIGFALLSSSHPAQESETGHPTKNSRKKYSPFTIGLSHGFSGKNKEEGDGFVYVQELMTAVTAYVSQKTKNRQLPHFDYKGDNFAVGLHKAGAANSKEFPLLGDDFQFGLESAEDDEEDLRKVIRGVQNITNTVHIEGPVNHTYGHAIYGSTFGNHANITYNNER